jgi:hypothetical protein
MTLPAELPPLRVIAAALRTTTERLVREVVEPQHAAPDWNEFEWAVARAVCAMQGISGLLATRLRWPGPTPFRLFLEDQHAHMLARDSTIEQLLATLNASFRNAGIAFVPLKGSAVRALQVHQRGERPQSDIDLLVDPADLTACGKQLDALGYELLFRVRRHDVYAPKTRAEPSAYAEAADNPLKIELHTAVAETLPVEAVDITASIAPVSRTPGANPYASLAALLRHVSLHAAGNMRENGLRFIQIYEVAQLARRMAPGDWRELCGEGAARAQSWWLLPPLALAARYLPGCVPAQVLAELGSVCPRRLRERYEHVPIYEVSWSNLRIVTLPGREWSRSLGDTLRFARGRLWPSREALDETAATQVAQHQRMRTRWYGGSRVKRIVRGLFARPPRVQTLSAVSAALRAETAVTR